MASLRQVDVLCPKPPSPREVARRSRDGGSPHPTNTDAGPLNLWGPADGVGVGSMHTEYRPMCEGTSSVLMPDGINPPSPKGKAFGGRHEWRPYGGRPLRRFAPAPLKGEPRLPRSFVDRHRRRTHDLRVRRMVSMQVHNRNERPGFDPSDLWGSKPGNYVAAAVGIKRPAFTL